jgi:hypothetical protein
MDAACSCLTYCMFRCCYAFRRHRAQRISAHCHPRLRRHAARHSPHQRNYRLPQALPGEHPWQRRFVARATHTSSQRQQPHYSSPPGSARHVCSSGVKRCSETLRCERGTGRCWLRSQANAACLRQHDRASRVEVHQPCTRRVGDLSRCPLSRISTRLSCLLSCIAPPFMFYTCCVFVAVCLVSSFRLCLHVHNLRRSCPGWFFTAATSPRWLLQASE